jgi:hypothetical protein
MKTLLLNNRQRNLSPADVELLNDFIAEVEKTHFDYERHWGKQPSWKWALNVVEAMVNFNEQEP